MSDFRNTRLAAGGFDAAADDQTVSSRENDGPIPGKRLVEVAGSNSGVGADVDSGLAALLVTLASALNKDIDSVDVGKMSKGGVTTNVNGATGSLGSTVITDCTGYNAILVHIPSITGTWDVSLRGADATGGSYYDLYDGATQMKMASLDGSAGGSRIVLWRGVPDHVQVVVTNSVAGQITVKTQPLNV